jgi:hypothetical protein
VLQQGPDPQWKTKPKETPNASERLLMLLLNKAEPGADM